MSAIEILAGLENVLVLRSMAQMDNDGVFGVPFFRVGSESFWGLDRLASAEAAFVNSSSVSVRRSPTVSATVGFDDDHAGGCG